MLADPAIGPLAKRACKQSKNVIRQSSISAESQADIADLIAQLGSEPMALVALFVSPNANFHKVFESSRQFSGDARVIGCTTAGEITEIGYDEGRIVAVGFPAKDFSVEAVFVDDLWNFDSQALADSIIQTRVSLVENSPDKPNGFGFLLVDGLSLREDALVSAISPAMAEYPLFGGSAGDGTSFGRTLVALDDRIAGNAAVLTLIRSKYETKVFTLNHLIPKSDRMVVTNAEPTRRIVKEINAEPAAREYARIVGKNPDHLDQFTFAAHPVIVRIGDEHHVRSIQRVNEAGELVFFSAIDEGMVLCVAAPEDMPRHLNDQLASLGGDTTPDAVLACDCILRRIEAQQCQQIGEVSKVLARHNVTGFSTYGEQFGPLHVNQTMTGVAFFNPSQDK